VSVARVFAAPRVKVLVVVMSNHVHLVVEVDEEVSSSKLLGDFKAYTTR